MNPGGCLAPERQGPPSREPPPASSPFGARGATGKGPTRDSGFPGAGYSRCPSDNRAAQSLVGEGPGGDGACARQREGLSEGAKRSVCADSPSPPCCPPCRPLSPCRPAERCWSTRCHQPFPPPRAVSGREGGMTRGWQGRGEATEESTARGESPVKLRGAPPVFTVPTFLHYLLDSSRCFAPDPPTSRHWLLDWDLAHSHLSPPAGWCRGGRGYRRSRNAPKSRTPEAVRGPNHTSGERTPPS